MEKSHIGIVTARTGLLLGGVMEHHSSRFATSAMAVAWCEAILQGNREAGREISGCLIRPDNRPPEIQE